jgi:hypothetical protein
VSSEDQTGGGDPRFGVVLVEEATAVILVKDTREPPRLVFKGLHVRNLDKEYVAWFCGFDLERPRQVVDLGQVHVLDIVSVVGVLDLSSCPVQTLDLDGFTVLDGSAERDWELPLVVLRLRSRRRTIWMPSVLWGY